MCSTIHTHPRADFTSFPQTRHFCKDSSISSHNNFILDYLLTPTERSRRSKYAPLCALVHGRTVRASC